jgi:hypothetical protein
LPLRARRLIAVLPALLASLNIPPSLRAIAAPAATVPFVGTWSSLGIAGRSGQAAAIDPRRHRLIVFGGRNNLGSRADLWELPLDSPSRWRRLEASGDAPPPMDRMSMILDPERDRLIIYGGRDSTARDSCDHPTCRTYGGVWALDLEGSPRWSELSPSGHTPAARSGHVAVYDPRRDCMFVFGGERVEDGACPCGTTPERLHDAWALRLRGRPHWDPIATRGVPPSASARGSAIYDPVLDRMVYVATGDTLFSLSLGPRPTWSAQVTTSLFAYGAGTFEGGARAVYDAAQDALFLFREMSVFRLSLHGDADWRYFTGGPSWFSPILLRSRELEDFSLGFDDRRSQLILFGGATSRLGLSIRWTEAVSTTLQYSTWSPVGFQEPEGLSFYPQLLPDPENRRDILIGAQYSSDMRVWSLDAMGDPPWAELKPPFTIPRRPYPRVYPGVILDAGRGRLVMFGGRVPSFDINPIALGDPWAFDLEDPRWDPIQPTGAGPSPRAAPVTIYDAGQDRMLLVGGYSSHYPVGTDTLWSLSLSSPPTWTGLPVRGPAPPEIDGTPAALDSRRSRLLVAVGWPTELWALNLGDPPSWEDLGPTSLPRSPFIYDAVEDQLLVIDAGAAGRPWGLIDIWTRDLATGVESRVVANVPPGGDWPPARASFAIAYEPSNRRVVLFGGYTGVANGNSLGVSDFLNDTWFLDLSRSAGKPDSRAGRPEHLAPHAPSTLAILGTRFDAASASVHVKLSLMAAGPARIVLYDLAGRRVATADIRLAEGSAGEVALPLEAGMRTGVYFVRVSQGVHTANARAIVIR